MGAFVPLRPPAAHARPARGLETRGVADRVARGRAHVRLPAGALRRGRWCRSAGRRRPCRRGCPWRRWSPTSPVPGSPQLMKPVESSASSSMPGAVERVGHRARAVVARVLPLAVPAAVLVRLGGDPVAGGDDRLDLRRRVGGGDRRGRRRRRTALPVGRARPRRPRSARRSTRPATRSALASGRETRPLTRRSALRSHARTRRAVPRPYWPSTVVLKPARVRKSWRTRTSRPRIPCVKRPLPEDPLGGGGVRDRHGHGTDGQEAYGEHSTA